MQRSPCGNDSQVLGMAISPHAHGLGRCDLAPTIWGVELWRQRIGTLGFSSACGVDILARDNERALAPKADETCSCAATLRVLACHPSKICRVSRIIQKKLLRKPQGAPATSAVALCTGAPSSQLLIAAMLLPLW